MPRPVSLITSTGLPPIIIHIIDALLYPSASMPLFLPNMKHAPVKPHKPILLKIHTRHKTYFKCSISFFIKLSLALGCLIFTYI